VLVDDAETYNTAVRGSWKTVRSAKSDFGPSAATRTDGEGDAQFTWQLTIPRSGNYEVFARYPQVEGAAKDATYTVRHAQGSAAKSVDQSAKAGSWVSLGRFPFTKGLGSAITLSDQASGTVSADAVKLVRDNSADADNERKDFQYRYDADGNTVQVDDRTPGARISTYAMTYDGLDRLQRLVERAGETVRNTTSFTYDENGNPTSRTHDDVWSQFDYDARDLVERVTNARTPSDSDRNVTTFAYDARGMVERQVKPNGNAVDFSYFLDGALQHQVERKRDNGPVVAEHTLEYGPNGDPSRDVSRLMNADNAAATLDNTYAYEYDPRDRIARVTKTGDRPNTETYIHDANSNVIEQTSDDVTTTHNYDRNRLVSSTARGVTSSYNYDPLGRLNTVSSGGQIISDNTYDGFDRISQHVAGTGAAAKTTSYTFDPFDRTASETTNVGAASEKRTDLNYLGISGDVLSEQQGGKVVKSYQTSPGGSKITQIKVNEDDGREVSHFTYHPKGDVEALTKDDGNTRTTYGYTAYGSNDESKFTGVDKPDPQNPDQEPYNAYRFNAHRFDHASGTYDMGFRDYDPSLNSFLTRDMYNGALDDLNLTVDPFTGSRYAFAGGNPISNIELDGHLFGLSLSDIGHAALDVVGLIPVVGEVADVANGAWYLAEGNYVDAALSFTSAIPLAGYAASAAKGARYGTRAARALNRAENAVPPVRPRPGGGSNTPGGGQPNAPSGGSPRSPGGGSGGPPKSPPPANPPPAKPKPPPPAAPPSRGPSCPIPNSFVAGTSVLMADGSRKPIEQVQTGDTVLATDPETGDTRGRTVVDTITGEGDKHLVEITVDTDGKKGAKSGVIIGTDGHPFWIPDLGTWLDAGQLKPGMWLRTSAGTYVQVTAVHAWTQHQRVHNLTVNGTHTYYVGTGETEALVHNCGKNQGVYEFPDQWNPGKTYVGKTNNFTRRLQDHIDSGRLARREDATCTHVCGTDDDLFIAEHLRMEELRSQGVGLGNDLTSPGKKMLEKRLNAEWFEQLPLWD
ncbi:MAG: polymorphic toxin-type HINT domain-containing protein, partial [Actinomadura sp.]